MNNEDTLASGDDSERGFPRATMRTNQTDDTTTERSTDSQTPRQVEPERFARTYVTVAGALILTDDPHAEGRWILCDSDAVEEVRR